MYLQNNKTYIDSNGRVTCEGVLSNTPQGLFTYGLDYTTGSGLLTTPAALAINLTGEIDPSDKWAINSGANGVIAYSGSTRYFQIHCDIICFTASGGTPSTISVNLQKQVGAGAWTNVAGAEADRYLSSTADTASKSLGGVVSMASGDNLRLLVTSTSDAPTYTFSHVNFKITNWV